MSTELTFGAVYRSDRYGADLATVAPWIERLGYDGIWFNETVLGRGPCIDALGCLAAAASCTRRIRLGTAVLLLPLHNPILTAKLVGQIDVISGGRVTLGIGVGGEWTQPFEALGIEAARRGTRANESIQVMKQLWSGAPVSHQGTCFQFEDISLEPAPAQSGGPPIWIGGRPWGRNNTALASLQRTARWGDGWLPYLVTPETYREAWQKIAELAAEAGRSLDQIEPGLLLMVTVASSRAEARRIAVEGHRAMYRQEFDRQVDKYDVFGTPDDCIKGIERYVAAGARHFVVQWRRPLADIPASIETVARKVLPYFR